MFPPEKGCSPRELARLAVENHGWAIARHLAVDRLAEPGAIDDLSRLDHRCPRRDRVPRARVTVAVCTRNRATQLRECLDSLASIDYPPDLLDILIVDNAP